MSAKCDRSILSDDIYSIAKLTLGDIPFKFLKFLIWTKYLFLSLYMVFLELLPEAYENASKPAVGLLVSLTLGAMILFQRYL